MELTKFSGLIEKVFSDNDKYSFYCNLVFGENYESAQWNYNDWFLEKVSDEIESITNPLRLPPWI